MTAFIIGIKILKGRAARLLNMTSSHPNNIYLHLEDIFKKPLQCLDFVFAYSSSTSTTKLITCIERTKNLEKLVSSHPPVKMNY